jgi:hypothetical protein
LSKIFDSKKFLERWKQQREQEDWLFAVAIVKAGLEREGNLDEEAENEIAAALEEFKIEKDELNEYLKKNRSELLRFLDSEPE